MGDINMVHQLPYASPETSFSHVPHHQRAGLMNLSCLPSSLQPFLQPLMCAPSGLPCWLLQTCPLSVMPGQSACLDPCCQLACLVPSCWVACLCGLARSCGLAPPFFWCIALWGPSHRQQQLHNRQGVHCTDTLAQWLKV